MMGPWYGDLLDVFSLNFQHFLAMIFDISNTSHPAFAQQDIIDIP